MNDKIKYEPQNPQLDFIFNLLPNQTQMEGPNESVKADRQGRERSCFSHKYIWKAANWPLLLGSQLYDPAAKCRFLTQGFGDTQFWEPQDDKIHLKKSLRVSYLKTQKINNAIIEGYFIQASLPNFRSRCNWLLRQSSAGDSQNTPVSTQVLV